jgi:phosphotransferase system HPr-like phosphotransfer protein
MKILMLSASKDSVINITVQGSDEIQSNEFNRKIISKQI